MKIFSREIVSDFEAVDVLVECLDVFLKKEGTCKNETLRFHITLVVRELLINAIEHGNKMDKTKKVYFSLEVYMKDVIILVKDEGDGLDLLSARKHLEMESSDIEASVERGRGFSLLRQYGCVIEKIDQNEIKVIFKILDK